MPDQVKENYMANMSNQFFEIDVQKRKKDCVPKLKTSRGKLYILTYLMPYSNYVFISSLLCGYTVSTNRS